MAADTAYDELAAELQALGRAVAEPVPDPGLVEAVMARLSAMPVPSGVGPWDRLRRAVADGLARRRRRIAVVVTAMLLALLATPPVRAAVADWFGFGGVSVRLDPKPGPSAAPPPPAVGGTTDLGDARKLVDFAPVVPAGLGPPHGVAVSADRRVLSMSWTDTRAGTVRLDQFDGRLDFAFAKTSPDVTFTSVDGGFALWFDEPHEVVVLQRDGTRRIETARLAGHTLIWERGGTTLRLEGDIPLARAIRIAETVRELP